jgi:hypothetical protein
MRTYVYRRFTPGIAAVLEKKTLEWTTNAANRYWSPQFRSATLPLHRPGNNETIADH